MRRYWQSIFSCSLAWTAFTCLAIADEPVEKSPNAKLFEQLDTNKDGQLTKDEIPDDKRALVERMIRQADKNQDGKLSADEFTAGLEKKPDAAPGGLGGQPGPGGLRPGAGLMQPGGLGDPAQLWGMMDRDGDGKVKSADIPEERRERFSKMLEMADKNRDGVLEKEEFLTMARRMQGADAPPADGKRPEGQRPEGQRPSEGQRPDGGPRPEGARPDGPPRPEGQPRPDGERPMGPPPRMLAAMRVLEALDTDHDGRLSKSELANASKSLEALDKNQDGEITIEEAMPAPGMRPGEGRPGQPPVANAQGEQMLERLKQLDKDGDGKWSKDEVPERMRERFTEMDKNKDGLIDRTEIMEAFRNAGPRPEGDRPRPALEKPRDGEDKRPVAEQPRDGDKPKGDAERPRVEGRPRDQGKKAGN